MSHCPNCPLRDRPCRGEPWHVERLCQLLDPACPAHDARYADVIRELDREHQYPPLARQAANLAHALWDWAVSGFSMASRGEVDRRKQICAGCPEWVADDRRCRLCGCQTDAKAQMKTEHCPAGKW